jgi:hypothetical protein
MMAIEARKIKFQGGIYDNAEDFYNWLEEPKKEQKTQIKEETGMDVSLEYIKERQSRIRGQD